MVSREILQETNKVFNQSQCMNPEVDGYSIDFVKEYYDFFNTFDGCYEYITSKYDHIIEKSAKRLHNWIRTKYDFQTAKEIVTHHFATETIEGYKREIETLEYLKLMFPTLEFQHTTPKEDYKYGVDYFGVKDGVKRIGFQIKPISWYHGIKRGKDYMLKAAECLDKKWDLLYTKKNIKCYTVMIDNENIVFLKNNRYLKETTPNIGGNMNEENAWGLAYRYQQDIDYIKDNLAQILDLIENNEIQMAIDNLKSLQEEI